MSSDTPTKVAVVQAAPVLFDCEASVEKACSLIADAAALGARLALLPEAFIPAYPRGLSFGMKVGSRDAAGRSLWERYWNNSIEIPGWATDRLGEAAREHKITVAIGVTERVRTRRGGALYCTLLYLGPDGSILGIHRKLKPTGAERTIWAEGDGSTLPAFETDVGVIGGLICWENYMPLARTAMYAKGVDVYLAPTADSRDSWLSTIKHIACEGRCYVLSCNQYVTKDMYPKDLAGLAELDDQPDIMCRGGSAIVSPMGELLAGPLFDGEGILTAEIDPAEIVRSRLDFDVAGHYARPDIFELRVNEHSMPGVVYSRPKTE